MQNAMKKNSDTPPPPLVVRERLRKRRYPLISSLGSLFHNSQPPTTATTTGIPTKRSSQKIAFRMKLTKFPIVQRPRVLGTKPVDCAFPTNHRKTSTAPATARIPATPNVATILQCLRMNLFQSEPTPT